MDSFEADIKRAQFPIIFVAVQESSAREQCKRAVPMKLLATIVASSF